MARLLTAGEIAAAIIALTGLAALLRNKVVRPLIATGRRVVRILDELLETARFARDVARELRGFSGAFTLFAVGIKGQVDTNTDRIDRLEDMREMVVDMDAALSRIRRRLDNKGDT